MSNQPSVPEMTVVCCVDRNYLELAGVMLRSLEVNGDIPEAQLVVCGFDLVAADEVLLARCVSRPIRFVRLDAHQKSRLASLPVRRQLTYVTYARLLLADILADRNGRLLYLDSDMVINGSFRAIFDVDLQGHALGAVPDLAPKFAPWRNRCLGRPVEAPYFNAGMQLIDLQPWRARNFGAQAISYAEENPEIVDWLDQDALNVVVGSDWSALPASWNWCTGGNSPGEFTSARIIHFTEQPKPNHVDCSHPAKQLFSRHRRDTPWRNSPLYPSQAKVRPRVLAGIGAKIAALKDLIFRR